LNDFRKLKVLFLQIVTQLRQLSINNSNLANNEIGVARHSIFRGGITGQAVAIGFGVRRELNESSRPNRGSNLQISGAQDRHPPGIRTARQTQQPLESHARWRACNKETTR
jgi:hypothetical protein